MFGTQIGSKSICEIDVGKQKLDKHFLNNFIYFGAVLGLGYCTWAFASCGKWGLLSSCGAQASHCSGLSYCGAEVPGMWASVVEAHGLSSAGSVVVVHRVSCSTTYGIFPDKGSNPCPLHW